MTFQSEPEIYQIAMEEARRALSPARMWPSEAAKNIMKFILPEWQKLFLDKNAGYGDMADELGPKAQLVDIHRKVGKLKRALWDGKEIGEEDIREVTMDLIGHCFLLLHTLENDEEEE